MPTEMRTATIIAPILHQTYGDGSFVDDMIYDTAERIDNYVEDNRGREYMIMRRCWDWFSGGDTAASVARQIEAALNAAA